jgi:DNA primase
MKAENLTYVEAIEFLAKRAGITIPQDNRYEERGISRKRIYEMNLEAAKYFRERLFDPNTGKEGMEYFMQKRGLSGATVRHFGLGYAPNSFSALGDYMHKKGFSDDEISDIHDIFYWEEGLRAAHPYDAYHLNTMITIKLVRKEMEEEDGKL